MDRSLPADTPLPPPDAPADEGWLLQYYTAEKPDVAGAPETTPSLTPQAPQKYGAEQRLGAGGEKEVVQVRDRDTLRDVALARPREGRSPQAFVREARILARLEHPNIVPVHDLGLAPDGRPYFTMKLLAGETLEAVLARLRNGDAATAVKFPLPVLVEIFVHVCDAVAFAHSRGVIHRDLKPANIQIGAYGEVRVIDWGLAKTMGEPSDSSDQSDLSDPSAQSDTRLGTIKGTPGYMAPEQAAGQGASADARTDIYALGALLHALLTWQPPVAGASTGEMLRRTVAGERAPMRPPTPNRSIPRPLDAIARKALAARPEDRYQTADALLADLRAFLAGYATSAEAAGPLTLLWLVVRRHRALALVIAASLLALATIGTIAVARIRAGERVAVAALTSLQEEHALRNRLGRSAVPRLLAEARTQIRGLSYDEALGTLRTAIGVDPSQAEAWDLAGWIYLGQEQFGPAASAFRHELQALVENPALASAAARAGHKGRVGAEGPGLRLAERGDQLTDGGRRPLPPEALQALADEGYAAGARYGRDTRAMLGAYFARRNPDAWTNAVHRALIQWAFQRLNGDGVKIELNPTATGLEARVSGAAAADLLPLMRLPLVRLDLRDTAVKDLQPLKGMPLRAIDLSNTAVVNVDALAGSPVRELVAEGLRRLPDDLFANCPVLETVVVSAGAELPHRTTWPARVKVVRR